MSNRDCRDAREALQREQEFSSLGLGEEGALRDARLNVLQECGGQVRRRDGTVIIVNPQQPRLSPQVMEELRGMQLDEMFLGQQSQSPPRGSKGSDAPPLPDLGPIPTPTTPGRPLNTDGIKLR